MAHKSSTLKFSGFSILWLLTEFSLSINMLKYVLKDQFLIFKLQGGQLIILIPHHTYITGCAVRWRCFGDCVVMTLICVDTISVLSTCLKNKFWYSTRTLHTWQNDERGYELRASTICPLVWVVGFNYCHEELHTFEGSFTSECFQPCV